MAGEAHRRLGRRDLHFNSPSSSAKRAGQVIVHEALELIAASLLLYSTMACAILLTANGRRKSNDLHVHISSFSFAKRRGISTLRVVRLYGIPVRCEGSLGGASWTISDKAVHVI
jgi:hypothetical protein